MEVDVLIVGAGPAGSTTARFCAAKDREVLMIDRRRELGHPVQCGELLPHTEEMYSIFPRSEGLEELFDVPEGLVHGRSEAIDLFSPGGKAYRCDFRSSTLDRRSFDKYLAGLAVEAGARLETGTSLLSLRDGVAETSMGQVRARVVVAADGPNSRTARDAGMSGPSARYPAVTCQAKGSFEPVVKMYFGKVAPGGYAWVIPKRHGANVGVGLRPGARGQGPREAFEVFVEGLGCDYSDVTMGMVPMSGPVRPTVRGRVVLVGDAAGQTMATNGGGIPTAMIAGRMAGKAVSRHLRDSRPLTDYERMWRAVMEGPLRTSVRTKRLADVVFPSDALLGAAMFVLGRRGLDRAIRCKRVPL